MTKEQLLDSVAINFVVQRRHPAESMVQCFIKFNSENYKSVINTINRQLNYCNSALINRQLYKSELKLNYKRLQYRPTTRNRNTVLDQVETWSLR